MEDAALFRIGELSYRVQVRPELLRAWEKRYGAVAPPRREGMGQRLYSDADIERLALLHRLTRAGHSIREVAALDAALAEGEMLPLMGWLREKVHGQGARLGFQDLLRHATGKPLDPQDFAEHLRARYLS